MGPSICVDMHSRCSTHQIPSPCNLPRLPLSEPDRSHFTIRQKTAGQNGCAEFYGVSDSTDQTARFASVHFMLLYARPNLVFGG